MTWRSRTRWTGAVIRPLGVAIADAYLHAAVAGAQMANSSDPRVGLAGGHWVEAGSAISNLDMVAHVDRPTGFSNPTNLGDWDVINSDLAFSGNYIFQGNFHGIQIWDVSDISHPALKTTLVCPGGQGDPSVYGNLMFVSVEATNGRVDCGTQGVTADSASPERMRAASVSSTSPGHHAPQAAGGGPDLPRLAHAHTRP